MWFLRSHGWGCNSVAGTFLAPVFVVIGPALAAFAVVGATGRKGAIGDWLVTSLRQVRFSLWWALLPPSALLVVTTGYVAAGVSWLQLTNVLAGRWPTLLIFYAFHILLIGLLEEFGWRGWLLPKVVEKASPFVATLLVALVWSIWHLPKLITGGPAALIFLGALLAYCFLLAFGASLLRGGVPLAALPHGSFNAPVFFFDTQLESSLDLEAFYWATSGLHRWRSSPSPSPLAGGLRGLHMFVSSKAVIRHGRLPSHGRIRQQFYSVCATRMVM
jgi:uncharacterized protein